MNKNKRVIRWNCFESNSSSQHVIVVTKKDQHVTWDEMNYMVDNCNPHEAIYIGKDGKWSMDTMVQEGFGRYPFELLTSFQDKLGYTLCEYLGDLYPDDPEWDKRMSEIKSCVKQVIPDFVDFRLPTRDLDIYVDQEGNHIPHKDLLYANFYDGAYHYKYKNANGDILPAVLDKEYVMEMPEIGGIDHQSAGLLKNFLKDKGISLKEFLTNKKYILVIDGDERCDWPKYKDSGLINLDFIKEEYDVSDENLRWLKSLEENKEEE